MRKAIAIILSFILVGCSYRDQTRDFKADNFDFEFAPAFQKITVECDGERHEYLVGVNHTGRMLAHLPNCKFYKEHK